MNDNKKKTNMDELPENSNVAGGDYFVKRNKRTDLIVKIICFFAAFILWFYVMQVDSPEYQESFSSIPVTLTGKDIIESQYKLSVYSGLEHSVEVTVKGRKSEINKVKSGDITASASLAQITESGEYQLNIDVALPSSLTLESISQQTLMVYVDERISRTVEIRPIVYLITEAPNQSGDPIVENPDVTITGPKKLLDDIDFAQVSIDAGKISVTQNVIAKISLIKTNGEIQPLTSNIRLSKSEVSVKIPVYMYKTLPLAVNFRYGYFNDANTDITITPKEVRVKGDPAVLANYDLITVATVDEKRVLDDETQFVALNVPDDFEIVDPPQSVIVDIKHKNTSTREIKYPTNRIVVENADGIKYEITDDSVTLKFRGNENEIEALKGSYLTVSIDLDGYSADTQGTIVESATVTLSDAAGKSIYDIGDCRIQVKIN